MCVWASWKNHSDMSSLYVESCKPIGNSFVNIKSIVHFCIYKDFMPCLIHILSWKFCLKKNHLQTFWHFQVEVAWFCLLTNLSALQTDSSTCRQHSPKIWTLTFNPNNMFAEKRNFSQRVYVKNMNIHSRTVVISTK